MSESSEYNKRVNAQVQREVAEAETLQSRYQSQLDRAWWEKRAAEAERRHLLRQLDPYGLGLYDPP